MLAGDFNSRTGTLNEIMLLEQDDILDSSNFIHQNVESIFNDLGVPLMRTNADEEVNNNGRRLIEMCKLLELIIVNGRVGSDRNCGSKTFGESSTLDYFICSPDLFPKLKECKVDIQCSLLSDKHKPIYVDLDIDAEYIPSNKYYK